MEGDFLAVDIGNSNIVTGIWQKGKWTAIGRFSSQPPSDDKRYYERAFQAYLKENGMVPSSVGSIAISSVVPALTPLWLKTLKGFFPADPLLISSTLFSHLEMGIIASEEIGNDILCNAYAVFKRYPFDTAVVDFGTALTVTTVSQQAGIIGVSIAPGLKTAAYALFKGTAQLPEVPLVLPESVLGRNTVQAIQSGVLYGYIGLVRYLVEAIREELGNELPVIATGGLSSILHPLKDFFYYADPDLTLDGMRLIYESLAVKESRN